MKIALFGTGMIGSRIAREALSRGHQLTVVARTPGKLPKDLAAREVQGDARDVDSIVKAVRGHDAVISAVSSRYRRAVRRRGDDQDPDQGRKAGHACRACWWWAAPAPWR